MTPAPANHELGAARSRWSAAEARVYPLAMISVPAYQQAIEAVGGLLAFLREDVHDHQGLLAFSRDPTEALTRLDLGALQLVGLAPDDLDAAACATRDREITQAEDQQRRVEAFRAAREAGASWVDVASPATIGLLSTVPELRVHLGLARGVRTTLEPDLDTGEPQWRLVPVDVDLDTGEVTSHEGSETDELVARDRSGWDEILRRLAGEWGVEVDARHHP